MTTLQHLRSLLRSGTARPWKRGEKHPESDFERLYSGDADGTGETVATWMLPCNAELTVAAVNHLDALIRVAECAEAYRVASSAAGPDGKIPAVAAYRDLLAALSTLTRPESP